MFGPGQDKIKSKLTLLGASLSLCGVGVYWWKHYYSQHKQHESSLSTSDKEQYNHAISPTLQNLLFGVTSIAWMTQLNDPNSIPKELSILNMSGVTDLFGNTLNTLRNYIDKTSQTHHILQQIKLNSQLLLPAGIIASVFTISIVEKRDFIKNNTIYKKFKQLVTHPLITSLIQIFGYVWPWYCMINNKKNNIQNNNEFGEFRYWYAMLFLTNILYVKLLNNQRGILFKFLHIRDIPYFSLISQSFSLFSKNIDVKNSKLDQFYGILSICHIGNLIASSIFGLFDNANIKVFQSLTSILISIIYLLLKKFDICQSIFVFFWIPSIFYMYYILGIPEITQIEKNLYLCNMAAIKDENLILDKYKISNIVELHDKDYKIKTQDKYKNLSYLSMQVDDRHFYPIIDKFNESNQFIQRAVDNGENVAVHCSAGVSRSATIVTAYLIHIGYTYDEAIAKMTKLRNSFDPNSGFLNQLKQYERNKRDVV